MLKKMIGLIMVALALVIMGCADAKGQEARNETNNVHYFRQLAYNHVSPYFPIRGIHEIAETDAKSCAHYIFKYDHNNRLTEIINNHPEAWKKHPLTHLSIYRIVFSYTNDQEIRTFFDKNNNQVANIRGVYKEVHNYDANGFKISLEFYDQADKAMQSGWGIARYTWEKKDGLIIERRYNINGEMVPVSPYFQFSITGLEVSENGFPKATYNLNEQLAITPTRSGVASYRDKYDQAGNHLEWAYYDKDNNLTPPPMYSRARKFYDNFGNVIRVDYYDANRTLVGTENFQYDSSGKLI